MTQESATRVIKSKKRVSDHGEVFTSPREVQAMLNLVQSETENIYSTFLEPACGTGNFLIEILARKLNTVTKRYSKSQHDWEFNAVIAVSSIYGVDILTDNVRECRIRLYKLFDNQYTSLYQSKCKKACRVSVGYILSKNILWGDATTYKTPDNNALPIVFSKWSAITGSLIQRADFELAYLLDHSKQEQVLDEEGKEKAIPIAESEKFPPKPFLKLSEYGA